MPFESDVVVREVDDTTWRLVEALRYEGAREHFEVPVGFETDFASVPRAFVWLIPKYGRYTKCAILHDFLCEESKSGRFDRDDADGIFRRTMRELGVSFLRRWIMWAAVSLATQWLAIRHHGIGRIFTKRVLALVLIAMPAIAFFFVPAIVTTVWGLAFWFLEALVFLALRTFGKKQPNRPRMTWRLS